MNDRENPEARKQRTKRWNLPLALQVIEHVRLVRALAEHDTLRSSDTGRRAQEAFVPCALRAAPADVLAHATLPRPPPALIAPCSPLCGAPTATSRASSASARSA